MASDMEMADTMRISVRSYLAGGSAGSPEAPTKYRLTVPALSTQHPLRA